MNTRKTMQVAGFIIIMLLATVTACKKNTQPDENPSDPGNVYVTGYTTNATGNRVATLWTNGTAEYLSDGGYNAHGKSVFVSGSDVYIGGSDNGAKLWKNKKTQPIDQGRDIYSVHVVGGDVYAVGERNGQPRLWKNGAIEELSKNRRIGFASGVFVAGNDVHISGFEYDVVNNQQANHAVLYWKNGVLTNLTEGKVGGIGSKVYVSGNDVYIAGYKGIPNKAILWKNGIATELTERGSANSVVVSGNSVYVAGHETDAGNVGIAKYWKDGTPTILSDGARDAQARSIFVAGVDVYISGYTTNAHGKKVSTLWKNGAPQYLSDGNHDAEGYAVFVK